MNGLRDAYLDVLLEVLRPLERLATKLALVRLQGHVNTDVRGDVVALHGGCPTLAPLASEVEVVGALAAHMALAEMILGRSDSGHTVGDRQAAARFEVIESSPQGIRDLHRAPRGWGTSGCTSSTGR